MKYTQERVEEVMRASNEVGYDALSDDEKKVLDWFDTSSQDYLDECRDNFRK